MRHILMQQDGRQHLGFVCMPVWLAVCGGERRRSGRMSLSPVAPVDSARTRAAGQVGRSSVWARHPALVCHTLRGGNQLGSCATVT